MQNSGNKAEDYWADSGSDNAARASYNVTESQYYCPASADASKSTKEDFCSCLTHIALISAAAVVTLILAQYPVCALAWARNLLITEAWYLSQWCKVGPSDPYKMLGRRAKVASIWIFWC